MQIEISVVIAIASVAWSIGLFIGLLTSKFISKKQCDEHRTQLWDRVDAIQDAMTGGPYNFEVRLMPKRESA